MNNLTVIFDPVHISAKLLETSIRSEWKFTSPHAKSQRIVEIPVIYGGERGLDLEYVAEVTRLSTKEVINRHVNATYTVYAMGSQPGAAYIAGLDSSLIIARRNNPRARVEAGAVCIAGPQTSVLVWPAPCGWHVIGHTNRRFFDLNNNPPTLLQPGDRIRFVIEGLST